MEFGILSIVPPIVAIAVALITKEVITSLLIGILSGGLIYTGGNIISALETVFELMGTKLGDNALMLGVFNNARFSSNGNEYGRGLLCYGKWQVKKLRAKKWQSLPHLF